MFMLMVCIANAIVTTIVIGQQGMLHMSVYVCTGLHVRAECGQTVGHDGSPGQTASCQCSGCHTDATGG